MLGAVVALGAAQASVAIAADDPQRQPRIVGGHRANPAEWPFAAAILDEGRRICGGSVVAPDAVLTAEHCLERVSLDSLSISTGSAPLSDPASREEIAVERALTMSPGQAEDIAMLRLARETSAPAVRVSTPSFDTGLTGTGNVLRTAGWGSTKPRGNEGSETLRETPERVLKLKRCRRSYGQFVGASELCAIGRKLRQGQNASSCFGDSGGPLVADSPEGRFLVGIVSYGGPRCGAPKRPSVYLRTAPLIGWIGYASACTTRCHE